MTGLRQCRFRTPRTAGRRGLTLVELMVAIAAFGVAMTVVYTFMTNSRRHYTRMSQRVEYQQAARAVLNLMAREVRSAGCDPAQAGFAHLPLADATALQLRMDLNGNGAIEVTEPAEDVTYTFVGGNNELTRDSGAGAQTVLRNVTALDFRYFDAGGNALTTLPLSAADRQLVRFVEIDITGRSDRGEPLRYVTRVFVRNG